MKTENFHSNSKKTRGYFMYLLICSFFLIIALKISTSNFHPEMCTKFFWKEASRSKTRSKTELPPKIGYLITPSLSTTNKNTCGEKNNWTMVTFVSSAVCNFERRNMIRSTWASVRYAGGALFHTVFVVGKTKDQHEQINLNREQTKNHDLMQIDVEDTYRSLANKSLAAMQWAIEKLPSNFFFTKIDDDVLVDVYAFKMAVDENLAMLEDPANGWPQFPIICTYSRRPRYGHVVRNRNNKNYVPHKMYRWPGYPSFCRGPMYTTRMDTVTDLYKEAFHSPMLHTVEDAWVTGILRQRLGMPDEMLVSLRQRVAHHFDSFKNTTLKDFATLWGVLENKLNLLV